jgi:hypothetical protein
MASISVALTATKGRRLYRHYADFVTPSTTDKAARHRDMRAKGLSVYGLSADDQGILLY